jgi:hypothetical protein
MAKLESWRAQFKSWVAEIWVAREMHCMTKLVSCLAFSVFKSRHLQKIIKGNIMTNRLLLVKNIEKFLIFKNYI